MREKIKGNIILILFVIFFLVVIILPKKENEYIEATNYIKNPRIDSKEDTLKIAVPQRANNLSMFSEGEVDISLLSRLINPSLFYKGRNNNVEKYVAEDYWYEDSGKTISVILNDDFKFSDGSKLTAENVLNTYKVLSDPGYNGNENSFLENLVGFYKYKINLTEELEGVEVAGERYIKFHFTNANFSNIYALMYPILNIDSDDYKYNQLGNIDKRKLLNGAGRYEILDFNDESIKLKLKQEDKNKDIKIKNIEIFNLSKIEADRRFRAGKLDIIYKYPKENNLEENVYDRIDEYSYSIDNQSYIYNLIGFHQNSKLFKNENYRRGLRNSIDIKNIVEIAFGEGVYDFPDIPVYKNSWFNEQKLDFSDKTTLEKELEKEYEKNGKYFVDKEGNQLNIELVYLQEDKFSNSILKNLIENIEKNGIKVNANALSTQEMYKALKNEIDYDIFISQRKMTEIPSYKYEEDYTEEQGYTITNLMEDGFLYLLEIIKEDTNNPDINSLKENWKESFIKTAPYIVLATENMTTRINSKIKGIYLNEFVGFESVENLKNIIFVD